VFGRVGLATETSSPGASPTTSPLPSSMLFGLPGSTRSSSGSAWPSGVSGASDLMNAVKKPLTTAAISSASV